MSLSDFFNQETNGDEVSRIESQLWSCGLMNRLGNKANLRSFSLTLARRMPQRPLWPWLALGLPMRTSGITRLGDLLPWTIGVMGTALLHQSRTPLR